MDKLRVIELFSGIGSQSAALKRICVEHEIIATADLDKEAMVSYAAIHCDLAEEIKTFSFPSDNEMAQMLSDRNIGFDFKTSKRFDWFKFVRSKSEKSKSELKKYYCACVLQNDLGDINEIKELPLSDFWTYSFPCQDISVAGKGEGIISGKTRSGCLYEVERLLNVAIENWNEPKYLMLENVKNLVGKKFKEQFLDWIRTLDELGYNTYWQVLNAKNYGIPQNRERVFAISIRKDIDDGSFEFPEPFELKIRLKDVLEDSVDEKYYIVNDKANDLIKQLVKSDQIKGSVNTCDGSINEPKVKDISNCIMERQDRGISNQKTIGMMVVECVTKTESKVINVGKVNPSNHGQNGSVIHSEGLARTVTTEKGEGQKVVVTDPMIVASRGRNVDNPSDRTPGAETEQRLEQNKDGISNTITSIQKDNYVLEQVNLRIRKLTPRECFRLMGFSDEDFNKAELLSCNSQLYKQAGNSIVVDVLCHIFTNLFKKENENG